MRSPGTQIERLIVSRLTPKPIKQALKNLKKVLKEGGDERMAVYLTVLLNTPEFREFMEKKGRRIIGG